MKFAKEMEQTLSEEVLPDDWIEAAIQYKALKKCINKVVNELEFLGLEKNTLKLILDDTNKNKIVELDEKDAQPNNPLLAEYTLMKTRNSDGSQIVPMLRITLEKGDQNLSDDHIETLGLELKRKIDEYISSVDDVTAETQIIEIREEEGKLTLSPQSSRVDSPPPVHSSDDNKKRKDIYILLNSDNKFFQMLKDEVENINKLRDSEEHKLVDEVEHISDVVKTLTDPRKSVKRSDLYKWRQLFKIYLDSEVYFRYNDSSISSVERSAEQIKKNFDSFIQNVEKSGILDTFRNKKSLVAYSQFIEMNYHLLKVLAFQSLNTRAFTKILKKFDKQTSLGVSKKFPQLLTNDHIFTNGESLARSICYVIQNSLLILVPQLEDYTCPICCMIAFKPIKLTCGHVFCVSCLVKLKQRDSTNCPMCRYNRAVELADSGNLDEKSMALMKKYFPLEIKEKMQDREKEKYEELVGHNKCIII